MKLFWFVVLVIAVALYEIRDIKKNKRETKELWIMIAICFISLIYGSVYIINPEAKTIARITMDLMGG